MAKTEPDLEKGETKRPHGPLQSKVIFGDKWLRKFHDLLYYGDTHAVDRAKSPLLLWKCQITHAQMRHVMKFYSQAIELRLTRTDFPEEVRPSGLSLQDPEDVLQAASESKVNPFEAAVLMRDVADVQLYWIRKVKHGERMQGMSWQMLRLVWRQRMNEHFEWVQMAEKTWLWPLTDEYREKFLQGIIQDEKDRGVHIP